MTTSTDNDASPSHHDPIPNAGIRIILLTELSIEHAEPIVQSIADRIEALGRSVESRIIPVAGVPLGIALSQGLEGASHPLVLVTTAEEPWTAAHLEPLLKAIDRRERTIDDREVLCGHVVGCRPAPAGRRWRRWFASLPNRLIFAVPMQDVDSPCQLHRLEALAAIPFQSASSFLYLEILAKATFFGHLLDEVDVPPLRGFVRTRGWLGDCRRILKEPQFRHASRPSEESQGEEERDHGPDGEDCQARNDVDQAGSLEDDTPEPADQLRQRKGLDEPLGGVAEPLR